MFHGDHAIAAIEAMHPLWPVFSKVWGRRALVLLIDHRALCPSGSGGGMQFDVDRLVPMSVRATLLV